jgi:hypothetical protein
VVKAEFGYTNIRYEYESWPGEKVAYFLPEYCNFQSAPIYAVKIVEFPSRTRLFCSAVCLLDSKQIFNLIQKILLPGLSLSNITRLLHCVNLIHNTATFRKLNQNWDAIYLLDETRGIVNLLT